MQLQQHASGQSQEVQQHSSNGGFTNAATTAHRQTISLLFLASLCVSSTAKQTSFQQQQASRFSDSQTSLSQSDGIHSNGFRHGECFVAHIHSFRSYFQ